MLTNIGPGPCVTPFTFILVIRLKNYLYSFIYVFTTSYTEMRMVKFLGVGKVNCVDERIEYSNGFIATM